VQLADGPADERLVADDVVLLDADHGLVDRVQLAAGQHRAAARHELESLRRLARLHEAGRLAQAADEVARRPHPGVVGNADRAVVHGHQLDDGAPQALAQPAGGAVAQAKRFLLQPGPAVGGTVGGEIEEEIEAVAAGELHREESGTQRGGLEVGAHALRDAAQDLVVELPSVDAFDAGEAPELQVHDAEVRHALVAQVGHRVEREAGHPVAQDALQPEPFQLVDHGR
jgi:hypothetical protein